MIIDWFTVGAQALNFLVLVWLMKRFLYKPVLEAIEQRESKIAAELSDADSKQKAANMEHDEFRQKNEAFDRDRASLLAKAQGEADAQRKTLLEDAVAEVDALAAKRTQALQADMDAMHRNLEAMAQGEVWAIVRTTLADLASSSLEDRIGEVFLRRLGELDPQAKSEFTKAIADDSEPTILATAFDLPDPRRAEVQKSFQEAFSTGTILRFETHPELVGGFELSSHGQKLTWSIAGYVASLESNIREVLEREADAKPRSEPTTNFVEKST